MTLQKGYSGNEVLERLLELMKGTDLTDDTPGLWGSKAWNESFAEILELCQNSYPGVTGVFPYGLHAQTENIEDAHTVLHANNSELDEMVHRWVSGTFWVASTEEVILCGIGVYTGTMYTAVGNAGKAVYIKNAGTGLIQINGLTGTSETIEGSTINLDTNEATRLFSDGVNWYEISDV